MGRLLDLLVLVLIDSAVQRLIEPWTFISLDTTESGEAIDVEDWSWTDSLPSTDYCLSIWLKIDDPTTSSPDAVYLDNAEDSISFFLIDGTNFWLSTNDLDERGGAYTYGVWFHLVLGAFQTVVYYALTVKPGKPVLYSYDANIPLDSSSELIVPNADSSLFVVSVM